MVTAYRNGSTAGVGGGNKSPKKRQAITGWSAGAVRRHTAWLYGIDADGLDGEGFALTLTVRDLPPSHEEWQRVRENWLDRLRALGVTRYHWVVEWQARGVPHIHAAIYWPKGQVPAAPGAWLAVFAWLAVADAFRPAMGSQDLKKIDGPMGWLQYMSKHASRGVKHYQRWAKPESWEKTGRLWGHGGTWPVVEPMRFEMSSEAYWRYRRLVRGWRIANARLELDPSKRRDRELYAKRMLACNEKHLSAVRGVSDWTPEDVIVGFVALLADEGYAITQRTDS